MLTRREAVLMPAAAAMALAAVEEKHLMLGRTTVDEVGAKLPAYGAWRPYPAIDERARWEALPADARRALVGAAEKSLGAAWPSLPASVFMDFKRNGNRTRWETLSFGRRNRLRLAALAECIENKGRFLDDIMDGLWLVCEETFWGVSAHIGVQKAGSGLPDVAEPIVDLFAAETANALAWIDYLLAPRLDGLSKLLRPRLELEVQRRVLEPCLKRNDFWWMGFGERETVNNWNPWINSNWLVSALLMEKDAGRRAAAVHKVIRSTDRFLDGYYPDGGCDEGPGYWSRAGASLFDVLDLLNSASAGKLNYFGLPLVKEIGAYIYRAHIAGSWYVNFADASARVTPDANLVWRYGKSVGDEKMVAHGAQLAASHPAFTTERADVGAMGRVIDALFHLDELRKASVGAKPPLVADVDLPGTQFFTARQSAGSTAGFFVAAQGGHNAESHNHNDVGNFIVFHDGEPVLIDVGVETYSAKTFSAQRYEIWTMQSAWHNAPTINGVMQRAGRQYEARGWAARPGEVSMNIEKAYPPEAGVTSWKRTIRLDRAAGRVVLEDGFQLARAGKVELSLITTRAVKQSGAGVVELEGGYVIEFDKALSAVVDEHSSEDGRLKPNWGPVVRRIRLTAEAAPAAGNYTTVIRKKA